MSVAAPHGASPAPNRNASAAAEQRRGGPADQFGLLAAAQRTGRRPVIPQGTEQHSGPVRHLFPAPVPGALLRGLVPGDPDDGYPAARPGLRTRTRGFGSPGQRTAAVQRHPEPRPAGRHGRRPQDHAAGVPPAQLPGHRKLRGQCRRTRATAAAGDRAATRVTAARRARTRPAATRATGTAETAIAPRMTHETVTGG